MLKVFIGFVVSVVLLSSAFIPAGFPRAYAASNNAMITQIQAGGVGAATQEYIVVYNNSSEPIDITGWCLTNKSGASFVCFSTLIMGQTLFLPAYSHAVAASSSLTAMLPIGSVTASYIPTSQSSGSITGSADTITLVDNHGVIIDSHAWTAPIVAGMQFERHGVGIPMAYVDSDAASDWMVNISGPIPVDETQVDESIVDICPNIEDIQIVLPVMMEINETGECVEQYVMTLTITEVFPNAVGSDEGNEFIEIFNPNDQAVSLSDYQLRIGPQYEDAYYFPNGVVIEPHEYHHFTNADIPFTLLNSSSGLLLKLVDGPIVSDVPVYTNPKEGESWAFINGGWLYTNTPTPGAENRVSSSIPSVPEIKEIIQPCPANQYRNLETNRCRLMSVAAVVTPCKDGQYRSQETNRCRSSATESTTPSPCKADQERNLETGRCRNIVSSSEPAPCKVGQERNPDTNRCRTVTKMPAADYGVLGAETKNSGNWYMLAAVGGVLLLALVYAIWEWHDEIGKFFRGRYKDLRRFARFRK